MQAHRTLIFFKKISLWVREGLYPADKVSLVIFPVLKMNPPGVDFIKKRLPEMIGRFGPSRARKALFF